MALKEKALELLKKPNVVNKYGMELYEIKDYFECAESQLNNIIKELKREKLVVAVPFSARLG